MASLAEASQALKKEERELARAALMRFANERLSNDELLAEHREAEEAWLLYHADLAAEDYSAHSREVLLGSIACEEERLAEATRQMERRIRAGRTGSDSHAAAELQGRFDAMRRANVVEGLETLGLVLRKIGREWVGRCLFHEDEHPSFSVNEDEGVWHCFACKAGGLGLVDFVVKRNHMSRVEALRFLERVISV